MIFRGVRTSMLLMKTEPDYKYYRDKGWLESDFHYPTRMNLLKLAVGNLFDLTASRRAKQGRVW